MMAYEDPSAYQAVFEIDTSHLVARDTTPKLGYMLGNPHLETRQEVDDPEADENNRDDEETATRSSSKRPTSTQKPKAKETNQPKPKRAKKPKRKTVYSCAWTRMIENTNTTPLWSADETSQAIALQSQRQQLTEHASFI